jgi:hypothetical protein
LKYFNFLHSAKSAQILLAAAIMQFYEIAIIPAPDRD